MSGRGKPQQRQPASSSTLTASSTPFVPSSAFISSLPSSSSLSSPSPSLPSPSSSLPSPSSSLPSSSSPSSFPPAGRGRGRGRGNNNNAPHNQDGNAGPAPAQTSASQPAAAAPSPKKEQSHPNSPAGKQSGPGSGGKGRAQSSTQQPQQSQQSQQMKILKPQTSSPQKPAKDSREYIPPVVKEEPKAQPSPQIPMFDPLLGNVDIEQPKTVRAAFLSSIEKKEPPKPAKPTQKTKVVVRKLPPTLTEEAFRDSIESFLPNTCYLAFYPGKIHPGNELPTLSRSHISFKTPEMVVQFHKAFNGHIYLDPKGVEYKASVEISPYQRVPREGGSKDARINTIQSDPHFLQFLSEKEQPVDLLPSAEIQLEKYEAEQRELKGKEVVKQSTPLIDFLREKWKSGNLTKKELASRKRQRDHEKKEKKSRKEKNRAKKGPKAAASGSGAPSPSPSPAGGDEKAVKLLARPKEAGKQGRS